MKKIITILFLLSACFTSAQSITRAQLLPLSNYVTAVRTEVRFASNYLFSISGGGGGSVAFDFRSITNGRAPGLPITNLTGGFLYPIFSEAVGSNVALFTNGYFTVEGRSVSNQSVYLILATNVPVRSVFLTYTITNVNPSGTVSPQFVFLIQTNSLGTLGGSLTLGNGVHIGAVGQNLVFQVIDGGIGATLGLIPFVGDGVGVPDNVKRWIRLDLDQPGGRITATGDNINGSITNVLLKGLLATGNNQSFVGWQQYVVGSTNLDSLLLFHELGVENTAATEARILDATDGNYAKLNQENFFAKAQSHGSSITASGAIRSFGASGTLQADDRVVPGDFTQIKMENGVAYWRLNSLDFLRISSIIGDTFFAPTLDNAIKNGTTSLRWSELHLGTGGLFQGFNTNAPASLTAQGALFWNDGTNACVVLRNGAGALTTNKLSMVPWP